MLIMRRRKEKPSFLFSFFGTDRSKAPEEISKEIFDVIHKKEKRCKRIYHHLWCFFTCIALLSFQGGFSALNQKTNKLCFHSQSEPFSFCRVLTMEVTAGFFKNALCCLLISFLTFFGFFSCGWWTEENISAREKMCWFRWALTNNFII